MRLWRSRGGDLLQIKCQNMQGKKREDYAKEVDYFSSFKLVWNKAGSVIIQTDHLQNIQADSIYI